MDLAPFDTDLVASVKDRASYLSALQTIKDRRELIPYLIRLSATRADVSRWVTSDALGPREVVEARVADELRWTQSAPRRNTAYDHDRHDEHVRRHERTGTEGLSIRSNAELDWDCNNPHALATADTPEEFAAVPARAPRPQTKTRKSSAVGLAFCGSVADPRQASYRQKHLEGIWVEFSFDEPRHREANIVRLIDDDDTHTTNERHEREMIIT